jgi:tetratricopeptide (TPR) repeat protein
MSSETRIDRKPKQRGKKGSSTVPRPAGWPWETLLPATALAAMVLIAYAPAVGAGFIWDDEAYVTANRTLRSVDGLRQIWFEPVSIPQYYPLVHTAFWIEYHLWGPNASAFHVINILLHATSAILVWRLLVRLRVPGAWLGAALFAVHPIAVESVAWVTERKNVLSLTLALAALLAYLRFQPAEDRGAAQDAQESRSPESAWRWYWLAFALFLAALLSKTVVASLPAVLLVIYWWKRGRLTWADVLPLVPFFLVGAGLGGVTAWLEIHRVGAVGDEWPHGIVERTLIAGRAVWFYARKLAWPQPLIFFYPRFSIDTSVWWQYLFPAAAVGLLSALWLARGRIGRGPFAAALIFGGVLFPALGFFNVYPFRFSYVANHFAYHASIALMAVAAAAGALVARRLATDSRRIAVLAAAIVLIGVALVTGREASTYHSPETLYRATIERNPESAISYANLALYLNDLGRYDEALEMARTAVRVGPREAAAHNNLGMVLLSLGNRDGFKAGQIEEAEEHLNDCLEINSKYAPAFSNLAYIMIKSRRYEEAISYFARSLEADPRDVRALYGMGMVLEATGKRAEAVDYYARALEQNPQFLQARQALARAGQSSQSEK